MTSTLSEEVYRSLAQAIVSGELIPGQRLDEPTVCRQFKVSRTPVREALRRLSGTGLVEMVPMRGATVSQIDVDQLTDMFDALGEFEALCARLAAERMTPLERRRLAVLNDALTKSALEDSHSSEANGQFHELIYLGAHNRSVAQVTRGFRQRVAPFQMLQFAPAAMSDTFEDHDAIAGAIIEGRTADAHNKMRDHITRTSLQVIDYFAAGTAKTTAVVRRAQAKTA